MPPRYPAGNRRSSAPLSRSQSTSPAAGAVSSCLCIPPAPTDLQRRVWETLLQIPHGDTWTYGQVAAAIGRPRAARPVGRAVGANPIAIVIPCHRVVGSSGKLTGYGGGLWRKQRLLDLERE